MLSAMSAGVFALYAPGGVDSSPSPAARILVFSKTSGFRHDSIADGLTAIEQLGLANGFGVDATEDGASFKAIGFRMAASELGQALLHGAKGRRLWLAGRAKIDDWGSRPAAELHLEDAAWAD